jgi:hypothetical protein
MKKTLLIFLSLPLLVFTQTNKQGSLKLRKQPRIQSLATIAGIFDGMITKETLLANPIIELNSSKKGEIISFNSTISYNGDLVYLRTEGDSIPQRALKAVKNYNLNTIYFEKIFARVDHDTIQLNNIFLKFGQQNSSPKKSTIASPTYFRGKNYTNVSKYNLSEIRNIKGIYDGEILQTKSFTVSFIINGNYYTQEITNEQDIKRLISRINYPSRGMRLYITNIKFSFENKEIHGTPICLKLTN